MRMTHHHLAGSCFSLVAILTLGCHDSTAPAAPAAPAVPPPTGMIVVTVSTTIETIDAQPPGGHALTIDSGPASPIGLNETVTSSAVPLGIHLVQLYVSSSNCSVSGANPRSVEVTADKTTPVVSFSVSCIGKYEPGPWDY